MNKILCIVGSHPQTRVLVPWDDMTCDIWTFNEEYGRLDKKWVQRCTGVFQMHPRAIWNNPLNRNDPHHGEWMRRPKDCEVFCLEKYDDVPGCVKYPLDEITEKYLKKFTVNISPRTRKQFLQTTSAYACALAMYRGYEKVKIYGIELVVESEYRYQRPSWMFWMGMLISSGVEVEYNGFAFEGGLYGYEAEGEVTKADLIARQNELKPLMPALQNNYNAALLAAGQMMKTWVDSGRKEDAIQVEALIKNATAELNKLSVVDGGIQHLQMYIDRAEEMMKAGNGDPRFSHHEFERDAGTIDKNRQKELMAYSVQAGRVGATWDALQLEIAQSRRNRGMKAFDLIIRDYLKAAATVALLSGAWSEADRLRKIMKDQMTCQLTTDMLP